MPGLNEAQRAILAAVVDRIVPPDQHPGGRGFGADRYISALPDDQLACAAPELAVGLDALGNGFVGKTPEEQDAALRQIAGGAWFGQLCELTQEGVYADPGNGGNINCAAWTMIGYEPRLPEGPSGPPPQPRQPPRVLGATGALDYDVIVIGAGAAGGVMACKLAEGGKSVLLLERGRELDYAHDGHRDHLRNHRLPVHGHNTGPDLDGNPRVFEALDGSEQVVPPHHGLYMSNASGVGSGTVLYGAQAWRFHPDDFRMASRYGVPEGSSLTDWPIGYDDLAPSYDWIEWEMGVSGQGGTGGFRARDYPMPPIRRYEKAAVLKRGADALGIETMSPPLLINTVPHAGRAACIECGSCVGFPCPSDAKTGTQNTMVPRALATGRTTLVTGATVERIVADPSGKVTGVSYFAENAQAFERRSAQAKAVVVSAGAIETARLLLLSGLGNEHYQVGRNLQGHYYPIAYGRFDADLHTSRGPGVSIATTSYSHGNPGVIGGAMLADEFVMLPAIFVKLAVPPSLPRWGAPLKAFMRDHYRQVVRITGPVHEIPEAGCRVTLAGITDRFGMPVARLSGATHPETVRTAEFISARASDWLTASGAREIWSAPQVRRLSAGQHQAGTCRMGTDPRHSVTDSHGRVWGHPNLFVSDASLHPTNGGFNPVLTILAMAARNADHILASLP
ncbi:MAG TPA: GMC family oxidoreductase [Devosia sp.]|nr:GMC family oxidoreductase [Devosia sp.]